MTGDRLLRGLALALVRAYQRWVSPYKGFRCPYHQLTGHRSCSHFGHRAFSMYGAIGGWAVLGRRFDRCAEAHRRLRAVGGLARLQRGDCDIGCIDCDGTLCDVFGNCLDCGDCDCSRRRDRRRPQGDKVVRIPPGRWPAPDGTRRGGRNDDAGGGRRSVRPSPPPP